MAAFAAFAPRGAAAAAAARCWWATPDMLQVVLQLLLMCCECCVMMQRQRERCALQKTHCGCWCCGDGEVQERDGRLTASWMKVDAQRKIFRAAALRAGSPRRCPPAAVAPQAELELQLRRGHTMCTHTFERRLDRLLPSRFSESELRGFCGEQLHSRLQMARLTPAIAQKRLHVASRAFLRRGFEGSPFAGLTTSCALTQQYRLQYSHIESDVLPQRTHKIRHVDIQSTMKAE